MNKQMNTDTQLDQLKAMLADGTFHHATYRNFGTLWEGLWIYRKKESGGSFPYEPALAFYKGSAELPVAEEMVRGTGVSVGAYGRG